jgi:hypothetical protein
MTTRYEPPHNLETNMHQASSVSVSIVFFYAFCPCTKFQKHSLAEGTVAMNLLVNLHKMQSCDTAYDC